MLGALTQRLLQLEGTTFEEGSDHTLALTLRRDSLSGSARRTLAPVSLLAALARRLLQLEGARGRGGDGQRRVHADAEGCVESWRGRGLPAGA